MRVPAASLVLLLSAVAIETRPSVGAPGPLPALLVLERTDDAVAAEGLVARRIAVYADGTVLATRERPTLGRGHLDPAQMAKLVDLVAAARLAQLPRTVESRASWFDLGDAACCLSWYGSGAGDVCIEGDLRPTAADRALAPHGFVEALEFLESIPIEDSAVEARSDAARVATAIEFTLEPWRTADASPFAALLELEPLEWPRELATPRADVFRAEGETAHRLYGAARLAQPVRRGGALWRLRAKPMFPHEAGEPTAAQPTGSTRRG